MISMNLKISLPVFCLWNISKNEQKFKTFAETMKSLNFTPHHSLVVKALKEPLTNGKKHNWLQEIQFQEIKISVLPVLFVCVDLRTVFSALGSALLISSTSTAFRWPFSAATCSAVFPSCRENPGFDAENMLRHLDSASPESSPKI